jgi:hypothetical protein
MRIRNSVQAFEAMFGKGKIVPLKDIVKAWRVWLDAHVEDARRDVLVRALRRLAKRSMTATQMKKRAR